MDGGLNLSKMEEVLAHFATTFLSLIAVILMPGIGNIIKQSIVIAGRNRKQLGTEIGRRNGQKLKGR